MHTDTLLPPDSGFKFGSWFLLDCQSGGLLVFSNSGLIIRRVWVGYKGFEKDDKSWCRVCVCPCQAFKNIDHCCPLHSKLPIFPFHQREGQNVVYVIDHSQSASPFSKRGVLLPWNIALFFIQSLITFYFTSFIPIL